MTEVCRTCLQQVGDSSLIFYLNAVDSHSQTITIRCKLADCVPEMDLDVVPNAFICNNCFESLTVAHEFKNKCLETEGRIQSYIEQMGYVLTSVDLGEIVQQSEMQPRSSFQAVDVKLLSGSNSDFSAVIQPVSYPTEDSSHEIARTTLYDTNKNPIVDPLLCIKRENKFFLKEELKEKSLDLTNLQCDTRAFFAVPKIAQLLAEDDRNPYSCGRCNYKASGDLDMKSHEEAHKLQKSDRQNFFAMPKIAQLLAEGSCTSNKCSRCNYIASSELDLKSHEETHSTSQKVRKCDTQDFFAVPKIAQLLTEGNGTCYKCSRCTYEASSDLDLKAHEETHLIQKLHKCTECNYSAPKRQTLIVHMRKHSREKPYRCNECGYGTPYRNLLVQHLRTHTEDVPYGSALSKHVGTHAEEKSFKCELCNYRGRLKLDLRSHMLRAHAGEKPYKCLLCDYCSSHKTNLGYHMKIHTGEKPYKCKICDYRSSQRANLQNHVRTHTAVEKPFKCEQCNYATARIKSLTTHLRIHAGEKAYSCTFCGYTSSAKVNLIKHITTHTGEKSYQCFDCGCKTVAKTDLERHIGVHSDEKPFPCCTCQKPFSNAEDLKRHAKHHATDSSKLAQTGTDSSVASNPESSATEAPTEVIGANRNELTTDATHVCVSTDFQINSDTNNCKSAVKKKMII